MVVEEEEEEEKKQPQQRRTSRYQKYGKTFLLLLFFYGVLLLYRSMRAVVIISRDEDGKNNHDGVVLSSSTATTRTAISGSRSRFGNGSNTRKSKRWSQRNEEEENNNNNDHGGKVLLSPLVSSLEKEGEEAQEESSSSNNSNIPTPQVSLFHNKYNNTRTRTTTTSVTANTTFKTKREDFSSRRFNRNVVIPSSCLPSENHPGIFLHYHKTGNNIGYRLIGSIVKQEPKGLLRVKTRIGRTYVINNIFQDLMPIEEQHYSKLLLQRPSILQTHNNIYLATLPKATKILHAIRDPVDMALSNYLYHAQEPTPERWVHTHNPCQVKNSEHLLQIVATTIGLDYDTEIVPALALCERIFVTENLEQYTFYQLLRTLPTYQGLQLATVMLLMANRNAGRSLLDMGNNAIRLREWHTTGAIELLSVEMQQWIHHPYDTSLYALNFLIEDCHLTPAQKRNISSIMEDNLRTKTETHNNHITQGTMDTQKREVFKQQLREDPILGSILRKLTSAINHTFDGDASPSPPLKNETASK